MPWDVAAWLAIVFLALLLLVVVFLAGMLAVDMALEFRRLRRARRGG